jgi:probable HAF family extracellular repeat protein
MKTILVLILAIFASFTATVHSQTKYTVTDLGVLPGTNVSFALGVNNLGHVTGNDQSDTLADLAFLYKNGKMQSVGPTTPQGTITPYSAVITEGLSINLFDQVVGTYYVNEVTDVNGNSGELVGFVYTPGLPLFIMPKGKTPTGINVFGDVIGNSTTGTPFVLRRGVYTPLSVLPGSKGFGVIAINNSGEIVGSYAANQQGDQNAVYWNRNGKIFDLGVLVGGYNCQARAINDQGWIVGSCAIGDGLHPFLCYNGAAGKLIDLGLLPNTSSTFALGINNSGVIVGDCKGSKGYVGFTYSNGVMRDINDLLVNNKSGWIVNTASGINDLGQIAGSGAATINGVQVTHALLLTPIELH